MRKLRRLRLVSRLRVAPSFFSRMLLEAISHALLQNLLTDGNHFCAVPVKAMQSQTICAAIVHFCVRASEKIAGLGRRERGGSSIDVSEVASNLKSEFD
jgi:hypothetical protein